MGREHACVDGLITPSWSDPISSVHVLIVVIAGPITPPGTGFLGVQSVNSTSKTVRTGFLAGEREKGRERGRGRGERKGGREGEEREREGEERGRERREGGRGERKGGRGERKGGRGEREGRRGERKRRKGGRREKGREGGGQRLIFSHFLPPPA